MLECLHFSPTTGSLHYDDDTVGVNDDTVGALLKCFAPISVGRVQTPIL